MSSPASAQRLRVALLLALTGSLALGSFWVLEILRKDLDEQKTEMAKDAADYVVENFSLVRLNKEGEARYNIAGSKLMHYPSNDSFAIVAPQVHSLAPGRAPMTLRAERALVENESRKVHLHDKVRLERPAGPDVQAMTMDTDYLLVLPDEDVIRTDKPVRAQVGESIVSAKGMRLDNTSQQLHLTGRLHVSAMPRGADDRKESLQ